MASFCAKPTGDYAERWRLEQGVARSVWRAAQVRPAAGRACASQPVEAACGWSGILRGPVEEVIGG